MYRARENGTRLRGSKLEARIEDVIRALAADAERADGPYVFNASEVARLVPTTRPSLRKHESKIKAVLSELDARRRNVSGDSTKDRLEKRVKFLEKNLADRDRMLAGLREHHIEIYLRIYGASLDGKILIGPVLRAESVVLGECVLCGTVIPERADAER